LGFPFLPHFIPPSLGFPFLPHFIPPSLGFPFFFPHSNTQQWYAARIDGLDNEQRKYSVTFTEYGNTQVRSDVRFYLLFLCFLCSVFFWLYGLRQWLEAFNVLVFWMFFPTVDGRLLILVCVFPLSFWLFGFFFASTLGVLCSVSCILSCIVCCVVCVVCRV
jgi:hypothetical protein